MSESETFGHRKGSFTATDRDAQQALIAQGNSVTSRPVYKHVERTESSPQGIQDGKVAHGQVKGKVGFTIAVESGTWSGGRHLPLIRSHNTTGRKE